MIQGLHHVTSVAGDPRANADFYTRTLGLRLVKVTVNFDDPGTYHLYYGDGLGTPGTILTSFPYGQALPGKRGTGEPSAITLLVPLNTLDAWKPRLPDPYEGSLFGERQLRFHDPDGQELRLQEANETIAETWDAMPYGPDEAIVRIGAVELSPKGFDSTVALLAGEMGAELVAQEGRTTRYRLGSASVDVVAEAPGDPSPVVSAGTIHHVAFSVSDDAEQARWLEELNAKGLRTSEVRDRHYFRSIYFREPGGILFEIATDGPGFATDEAPESLGAALRLPPEYEAHRARIEAVLPKLA